MRAYPTPDQEAVVRQIAIEEGVDPNLLISVWEQESSKSVNPALTGPVLPEGHKYAGHYGRGPFQIMSFHGPIADDFKGQVRWAARHLKQKGVRGYYGETAGGGSAAPTGMPGFPSTDSFEQQVMARVPGAGMLAQAGVADVPQGLGFRQQQAPRAPGAQAMPQASNDRMGGLLSDPFLLLGASILANNNSKRTGKVLGRGLLGGLAAYQAAQEGQALQEWRQQQMEASRMKQEAEARQQEMQQAYMQMVLPALQGSGMDLGAMGVTGALMGIPGAGSLVQYDSARQPYREMTLAEQAAERSRQRPYEEMTAAERAAEGQRQWQREKDIVEMRDAGKLPPVGGVQQGGAPQAMPMTNLSPAQARDVAAEAAKAEAKKRAEANVDLPKAEATAAQTIKTIDDLIAHPGRTWATGSFVGRLPALPGDAYDFKAKLDMAKGQVFLRAYETLKGGGQITQIEGEKAEKAMAALDRAQSEEAFLQGLKDLRDAVEAGQRKLREVAGVQGGMEGPAPMGGADFRFENGRLVPVR